MNLNQDQLTSLLRGLLAAGGPLAGLLINTGLQPTMVNNILAIALIVLPPIISIAWGVAAHSDEAKIAAAAAVPGVRKIAIVADANGGAATAAADPALPTVRMDKPEDKP